MASYDGSLKFDTAIDTKGFNQGTKNLGSTMSGLTKTIKAVGVAIAGSFVVKGIKSTIDAAEELQNAMTGLKSIMDGQGKSFSNAQRFIEEYTADGLIPANNAITAYKNLALRGYDTSQIEAVMTALKDSATYGRQSAYNLGEAVQSASEGLKNENSILVDNAGVTKNVAKMWDEYAKSIGKSSVNLTQQEKIQAEVNGILEETKFQTGDAATYANSYSGQIARLNQQWLTFKQNVGSAFMTLAQAVLPVINTIMAALVRLSNVFKNLITAIFGKVVKTNEKVASSAVDAGTAISDMGTSASEAGEQANEALLPFDDLNVLQEETASGGTSGGGTSGGVSGGVGDLGDLGLDVDTSSVDAWTQKVMDKINQLKEFLQKNAPIITSILAGLLAGFVAFEVVKNWGTISAVVGGVVKAFSNLGAAVSILWTSITGGEGIIAGLAAIFGTTTATALAVAAAVAAVVAALVYLYQTSEPFQELVNTTLASLMGVLSNFYNNVLVPIFNLLWDIFNTVIVPLATFLIDVFVTAVEFVASVLLSWWNNVMLPIYNFLVDLFAIALEGVIEIWEAWKPKIETIMGVLNKIWNDVLKPIVEWIKQKLMKTFEDFGSLIQELIPSVKEMFTGLKDFFVGVFTLDIEKAWDGIKGIFSGFSNFLTTIFEKDWSESFGFIGTLMNQFFDKIENIWNAIKGVFGGIITFIKGVFTGDWEQAWEGVKQIFSSIWDGLTGIVKGVLNGVIDAINWMIDGINKVNFTVPDWVPVLGGEHVGLNIPTIPRLATGAVIPPNNEFIAVLGDQKSGNNLEAPESLIRQIVREEAGANSDRPIYVNVQVSGKTLLSILTQEEQEREKANGYKVGGGSIVY